MSTGVASRMSTAVTRTVQTKIGIRKSVMPGARILKIVVMKFTAPRIDAVPTSARPMIHRSVPTPSARLASGVYEVQPSAAAPPNRYPLKMRMPPSGRSQKLSALMRGKAMSGAPSWSGTM